MNNKEVPKDFGIKGEVNEMAADSRLQCPHVYGALNPEAVVTELKVTREDDGTFVSIEDLRQAHPSFCSLDCRA